MIITLHPLAKWIALFLGPPGLAKVLGSLSSRLFAGTWTFNRRVACEQSAFHIEHFPGVINVYFPASLDNYLKYYRLLIKRI